MNALRRIWRWLTTPRKQDVYERIAQAERALRAEANDQIKQGMVSDQSERERKAHLVNLPEPPDMTDDPQTEVPPPHPGQVQHVDLSKPVPLGQEAPHRLADVAPSDWDLLSEDERALFEQITPRDETKLIKLPAPAEQSTQDWVTEQLAKAGYSESYHQRFLAFRRVAVGMSMRHLNDLKLRAEARDKKLSTHDLIALRSRGIC
jgi:hypothetical protein